MASFDNEAVIIGSGFGGSRYAVGPAQLGCATSHKRDE
jgi:hypothetical protein